MKHHRVLKFLLAAVLAATLAGALFTIRDDPSHSPAGSSLRAYSAAAALPSPDTAFQAWDNAFLVQSNGQAYYTDELKSIGTERAGEWVQALDINVAQDVYDRTHVPADRQLASTLVTTLLADEGTDWASWDTWNDNVAWMLTAVIRGYQQTGDPDWLTVAEDQWNAAYNRGWSSDGGGGIWENMANVNSKCALSNDPMIFTAVWLYELTGDGSYLNKAEAIYSWVRATLVDPATGVVNECLSFPDGPGGPTTLVTSDNAYNAGSFIEAADNLYRVTGDTSYLDDGERTASHFTGTVPIVANNQGAGSSYQYWLFKGMSDLCTDAGNCGSYAAYMQSNAAQAWSERNSANLTWNNWAEPTTDTNPDAFEMVGMVALFQVLPTNAPSPFYGNYEIAGTASGLSLGVAGDSTANAAPVAQSLDSGDASASWALVPESNGYYEIKNARSGQLLNINAASGELGALTVQWPAGSLSPGNDQWLPIQNSDGTWSFYNRNSQLALDDPAGSEAAGTQYEQWAPNDTANQRFTLISRTAGPVTSGITGTCLDDYTGSVTDGTKADIWDCLGTAAQRWTVGNGQLITNGKCLDITGAGTANSTPVDIWDCNGGANQQWTPQSNGTLINPASGRCLDDPNLSTTNGTQLDIWDCNDGANQRWTLPTS